MNNFDFDNVNLEELTQADFDNIDLDKLSPSEVLKVALLYRAYNESKAIHAWQNMEPYSLGDEDPAEAVKSADYVYMLCVTKVGQPAIFEFDGEDFILVSLKPYMVDEDDVVALLEYRNKVKKENMYLYKCDYKFILAQMHNFKCERFKLVDQENWYNVYGFELEDDDEDE